MARIKQLTVAVENRPGTLAHVAEVLGNARVNILAFLSSAAGTQGSIQLVVDNVNRARKALDDARFSFTESTAEQIELPNKPGALAQWAGKLAAKNVNISTAYAAAGKGAKKAVVVLVTEDAGRAAP